MGSEMCIRDRTDIRFEISAGKKIARQLHLLTIEGKQDIDLTEDDLVFLTPGGCVENSALGSQDSPAAYSTDLKEGGGWDLWGRVAAQDPSFGHPDKFCSDPEKTNWICLLYTSDAAGPLTANLSSAVSPRDSWWAGSTVYSATGRATS